jgi:endo-1,4-beta-xylanase
MGAPIHAVGIQAHLSTVYRASPRATLDMINAIADLGLDVFISELDVNDSTLPQNIAERDRLVAEYYEEFLTPVLAHGAVKRLVFWGISDYDNWVVQGYTQEKRKAGTGAARPALFDSQNRPKPAFHAVMRALASAPARTS